LHFLLAHCPFATVSGNQGICTNFSVPYVSRLPESSATSVGCWFSRGRLFASCSLRQAERTGGAEPLSDCFALTTADVYLLLFSCGPFSIRWIFAPRLEGWM
jgi:hypothetical protein